MAFDVKELFKVIDTQDAAGFASHFTEDGLFRFGNDPTVKGRAEITNYVEGFFSAIKALEHTVIDNWKQGDVEIAEVEVTYTRHDDSTVDLMAGGLFRMQGDEIADYRIYMDINPLFAPAP